MGDKDIIKIKYSTILKLFGTFLNPLSPVLILVVSAAVNWLTVLPSNNYPPVINFALQQKGYIFEGLIFWLIIAMLYQHYTNERERSSHEHAKEVFGMQNQIDIRDKSISDLNANIDRSQAIILNKYGEFVDFQQEKNNKRILKTIVNKYDYVDAIQLYSVTQQMVTISDVQYIRYVIRLVTGYCAELIELNAIQQEIYEVKKQSITYLKALYDSKLCDDIVLEELAQYFHECAMDLKHIRHLQDIKSQDYANLYLLNLYYSMVGITNSDNNGYARKTYNDKTIEKCKSNRMRVRKTTVERELETGKRVELLQALICEEPVTFKYTKANSSKIGRWYVATKVFIDSNMHIMLFSMNNGVKDTAETTKEIIADVNFYFSGGL